MPEVRSIEVDKISISDYEVRVAYDEEEINGLAASISRIGVLVPLVVSAEGDKFFIVAGHRRYRAAKVAGLEKVPAIVRKAEASEQREVSIAENLFRKDLTPIEQACMMDDVYKNAVMTIPELAKAMHRSEHWVSSQMGILNWPQEVLDAVHCGWLSVSAASNIALVNDETYRNFLLKNAAENGATARTTAAWLQAYRASAPPEAAIESEPVAQGQTALPAMPQAPCLSCGGVFRTDELSHVPLCCGCISAIRNAVRT